MSNYVRIEIEQIGADGKVFRTFVWSRRRWEVDEALQSIRRGYNMERTRVTVAGEVVS